MSAKKFTEKGNISIHAENILALFVFCVDLLEFAPHNLIVN